ncbi:endonuclease/exonuclease/phosphatase family protein [Parapedobacter pyrenivorans]|nr:endonuclease/exonuclease/phosphatase family protein [Parapedobacter pyrenivorans]
MKMFIVSLLFNLPLVFSCAVGASGSEDGRVAPSADTITVMAYNIHHCNPPSESDHIDVDTIAQVIRKQNPDFVALQEVDVHTNRSGKELDQAKQLAELTGMHYYFKKAIDHDGGEYGVAILSRWPIQDTASIQLPIAPDVRHEPRVVAVANVTLPSGRIVQFASTHLDLTEETRVLQAAEIVARLGVGAGVLVIGGDFNARPGSKPIQALEASFQSSCAPADCPYTIPVDEPKATIDYLFYRKSTTITVLNHYVVSEKYASDHLPIVATLRLE